MAIIQEKGMVRAIKGAYRHGGYNVLNLDGDVVIYTEEWCVRCPWNKLPRKALATIVEHLGMIPENGEAVNIEKDGQPQAIMAGVATEEAAGWTFSPATVGASYVPVTFRGYQLFQEVNSRQAYGVDPTALAIVERTTAEMGTAGVSEGRTLGWSHDGETVMLAAIRKTTWAWDWEKTVWEALESVDLHKREG
jgi:hypothetical protein